MTVKTGPFNIVFRIISQRERIVDGRSNGAPFVNRDVDTGPDGSVMPFIIIIFIAGIIFINRIPADPSAYVKRPLVLFFWPTNIQVPTVGERKIEIPCVPTVFDAVPYAELG